MSDKKTNIGAGKGDSPRNCFSEKYRNNYDSIDWSKNIPFLQNEKKYIKKIKNKSSLHLSSVNIIDK